MASKTSRGVALIPLTITYGVDRSDVTLPQSIPLVELLPGMVETVGAFTDQPTNDGFAVRTASGRLLDQSKSLSAQGVRAGAALTLEPLGEGAADMVYDDLTEAVGQVVERVSTPWTREDARTLAALAAAGLIFVAALLLATTPPDALTALDPQAVTRYNLIAGAIGIVSALLVTATSVVMTRKYPGASGVALAHTVPPPDGRSCSAPESEPLGHRRLGVDGLGLLIGALAVLTLPKRYRISIAAPLVVGTVLAATGLLVRLGQLSQAGISAILFALIIVLLQVAPWIALAHIPVRILDADTTEQIPAKGITDQVSNSFVFVVALRSGGAVAAIFLTISLMTAPEMRSVSLPLTLLMLGAVSLVLQTRSIRARVEVLLGALSGLIVILVATVLGAYADPRTMPWLTLTAIATALVLVVTNVVGPRARPHLTRIADTVSVLSLFVLLPLAVYLWS